VLHIYIYIYDISRLRVKLTGKWTHIRDKATYVYFPTMKKKNALLTCVELRQHLKRASHRVAWNTGLVCAVCGGRDFDPISSSCHPCVDGWTCDPILRRIGTIPSAPIVEVG